MDDAKTPNAQQHDEEPISRTGGMSYRSPTDDNRRTTQQVVVPRPSGIHAVMQRGPRVALVGGGVMAILFLVFALVPKGMIGQRDSASSAVTLPTLTHASGTGVTEGQVVLVFGTGESGLFLRSAPLRDADILATLADGTPLTLSGVGVTADGEWLPVRTADGVVGWVAAAYTRAK